MAIGKTNISAGAPSGDVEAHNADKKAHPSILTSISEIGSRVLALEIAGGTEITANPFAVTFGNLDGLTVSDGVWNTADSRIDF